MCLNSSKRRRADHAQLAGREHRLDQRRQIHRAAGRRAGADGRVDFVDEENRLRPLARARAITALKRSSKSPRNRVPASSAAGVEREDLRALRALSGTSSCSSRVASPSAIAVLPTPASPTNTGLFLRRRHSTSMVRCSSLGAADQRIERACARALGQVDRSTPTADRARCCRLVAAAGLGVTRTGIGSLPPVLDGGTLVMPCEMYSRMSSRVTPCSASSCAACVLGCCSIAARMSPACTSWRLALCTCSTAVCSTRRNASVCSGSLLLAARELLDRLVEVLVEVAAQPRQIGAAGGENPLAVRIVRERVEQVLERQVRVPPRTLRDRRWSGRLPKKG